MVENDLSWIHTNLKGLPDSAVVAPGGTGINSFNGGMTPELNEYSYRSYFDDSGGAQRYCSQATLTTYAKTITDCNRYELRWRSEVDNTVKVFKSHLGW